MEPIDALIPRARVQFIYSDEGVIEKDIDGTLYIVPEDRMPYLSNPSLFVQRVCEVNPPFRDLPSSEIDPEIQEGARVIFTKQGFGYLDESNGELYLLSDNELPILGEENLIVEKLFEQPELPKGIGDSVVTLGLATQFERRFTDEESDTPWVRSGKIYYTSKEVQEILSQFPNISAAQLNEDLRSDF